MKKTLIIYGSTTGNTETMAKIVQRAFQGAGIEAETKDVIGASPGDLTGPHDLVMLGCPAYGEDEIELQQDFAEFYEKLDGIDLSGRKFAVFAPGDRSYTHFCGSVDMLEEKVRTLGGTLVVDGLKVEGDPDDEADEIGSWCLDLARNL
jgi:flavodoxin I